MAESDAPGHTNPHERVSPELLLAAIERAARHQVRRSDAVPIWSIAEHLGLSPRSGAARRARAQLGVLEDGGWVVRSRRHSVTTWALSDTGRCRLRLALRKGEAEELPEAPQHRAWRAARTTAEQEIERLGEQLRERLHHGLALLDKTPSPRSDAWFELAEQLQRACRRVGSASHCAREWREPDDARADVDELLDPDELQLDENTQARLRARRTGRRNVRLWRNEPSG